MDYTPEFLDKIQAGKTVRLKLSDTITEAFHIRAVVDGGTVVIRRWNRRKQAWNYFIESLYYFWLYYRDGKLK